MRSRRASDQRTPPFETRIGSDLRLLLLNCSLIRIS
jgi:hypothetical protein